MSSLVIIWSIGFFQTQVQSARHDGRRISSSYRRDFMPTTSARAIGRVRRYSLAVIRGRVHGFGKSKKSRDSPLHSHASSVRAGRQKSRTSNLENRGNDILIARVRI